MTNDYYWVDCNHINDEKGTVGYNDFAEAADFFEKCVYNDSIGYARFSDSADNTINEYIIA